MAASSPGKDGFSEDATQCLQGAGRKHAPHTLTVQPARRSRRIDAAALEGKDGWHSVRAEETERLKRARAPKRPDDKVTTATHSRTTWKLPEARTMLVPEGVCLLHLAFPYCSVVTLDEKC